MVKYAVFVNGEQRTEFELTERRANLLAKSYREDGETDVEVVERELKLEETAEYWK